ncbi:MAG: TonB-dependent receptor [Pseudomonadota bacterium]|uniref:TonB-dependent receptor plug domain-containing protein n=1 Tax=unclassified Phenylobacterium TaxID=2640670 RepID=UPI0006F7EF76|nr:MULTISPECIES: TonB-dependent receptor [unclassified Phenylobacterium]KRB52874.1 hypothetical protein ASE02_00185 [Phenylobacterium sp. Root700]MBT9471074.1 TonB-dependent receptor [Phenylobacterium sp.]
MIRTPLLTTASLAFFVFGGGAWAADGAINAFPAAYFAAAQPYSALDMIARLPGFSFEGGDREVRGLAGAGGNVLIDGKPPTGKQESLEAILRRIPATSVERIELIRPGAPGVDMQGRGLLANVVRVRAAVSQGRMEAATAVARGGLIAPGLAAEMSRRSPGQLLELSAKAGREYDPEKGRGPRVRRGPGGDLLEQAIYREDQAIDTAVAAAGYERGLAGGKLRLDASARRERTAADILDVSTLPTAGQEVVDERETLTEFEVGGRYDRQLGDRWRVDLLALHHQARVRGGDTAWEGADVTATRVASDASETIARGTLRRQAGATTLELGAEAAVNILDSHSGLEENGAPVFLPAANVRIEEQRGEVFATATWRLASTLTAEAGSRFEVSRLTQTGDSQMEKSFHYLKPRGLLTWSPGASDQLRLEVERQVGQLDFEDFVSSTSLTSNLVSAGNADLEPDKTWRVAATWERRLAHDAVVVMTLRRDWIADVIDRTPVAGPGFIFDAPGNIGDGERTEFELGATLPLDALKIPGGLLKTAAIWRRSRVTDPTTGLERVISGEAPFEGAIHFTQDLPAHRVRWGVDVVIGEKSYEYRFNEVRRDENHTRYGLFAEYRPAPAWNIRIHADNVASGKAERRREQYAGPRGAAGLKRIETRSLDFGPSAGITVQRSFGR